MHSVVARHKLVDFMENFTRGIVCVVDAQPCVSSIVVRVIGRLATLRLEKRKYFLPGRWKNLQGGGKTGYETQISDKFRCLEKSKTERARYRENEGRSW